MDQNLEPIEPRTSLPVEELAEGSSHADSVKDRLTGTDADRFIDLKKPEPVDNRTPSEVAELIDRRIDAAHCALRSAGDYLSQMGSLLYDAHVHMAALRQKQRVYDEALMKANAQISAGLPKYPKMLYGLNGGTFIATTEAIHKNIENHTRTWPNATKLGWFETPTERDNYAKAHGLL